MSVNVGHIRHRVSFGYHQPKSYSSDYGTAMVSDLKSSTWPSLSGSGKYYLVKVKIVLIKCTFSQKLLIVRTEMFTGYL